MRVESSVSSGVRSMTLLILSISIRFESSGSGFRPNRPVPDSGPVEWIALYGAGIRTVDCTVRRAVTTMRHLRQLPPRSNQEVQCSLFWPQSHDSPSISHDSCALKLWPLAAPPPSSGQLTAAVCERS